MALDVAGSQVYELGSALKSVANQGNIEFVDVTPVMQREEVSLMTKEALTVSIDLYDLYNDTASDSQLEYILFPGQVVQLTVYETGLVKGGRWSSMYFLIEDVQRRGDSKSVRELSISGRRQGAMLKDFGTIF